MSCVICRLGNKKFAQIFEGSNIATQPRRFVSPYSHVDFRLQPAAGSASTPQVTSACRIDFTGALFSRSTWCCRVFHCLRLESLTNNRQVVTSGLRNANRSRLGSKQNLPNKQSIPLNCTNSQPRARWYQILGPSLIASKCVCPQCSSSFVIPEGSARSSAMVMGSSRPSPTRTHIKNANRGRSEIP